MAWRPRNIIDLVHYYRDLVEDANGTLAKVLAREGARIERAMIAALAKDRTLTTAEAKELRDILRRIVAREAPGQRFIELASKNIPEVAALGVRRVAASAEVILGPGARLQRIFNVSRAMRARIEAKKLEASQFYGARWGAQWTERWTERANAISDTLEEMALKGADFRATAKAIENQLEGLTEIGPIVTPSGKVIPGIVPRPIRGQMHRTAFARAFARTSGADAYNRASIEAGQEVGFAHYVNIGVPAPTQSEICFLACQVGAMTLAEWDTWRRSSDPSEDGGRPLRHVWHCHCSLHAVPQEAVAQDWSQANPDVEERMAA